ncbi:Cell wall-active antibiotics response 4TMS YvqF [Streptacidiphilus jiangxiensis]|uniref:Cell wall-active antibiotics response 4TMS YvqF n=1 Tax=Streptacidiphilus jiangxiensis TaxID=235985 RepID=A0A1H7FMH3_STRJI|nr:Cell wall-active antibiotics response 4TMS YvqF [Streptacidiphilus jiangxiensis]
MPQPAVRSFADPAEGDLRASDADRERVAAALRDAYAEGRLDAEEHSQRLDAAYAAKTLGELVPLTRDLPAHDRVQRPGAAPARAEEPVPATGSNEVVAIFGGAVRKGRFRTGRFMKARAIFGGITIDLTEAVFDVPELVIEVNAVFGGIDVKVPDNVSLHGGGAGIFGGFDVREEEGTDPNGPVVTIRGKAVFGGVSARQRRHTLGGRIERGLGR